jgi:hypothetical protein
MLSVNSGKVTHVGPPGSSAVPEHYLHTLAHAMQIIRLRIVGHYQSDKIFKALPGKRPFRQMFNDHNTWVNYDPSNKLGQFGWTIPATFPHDIVITQYALRMGHWSVAGTIVHELAHLDGADGTSDAAERTLKYSGLRSPRGPFDPAIRG